MITTDKSRIVCHQGFTLLEVMIVIFLLGLMTAMAWSFLGTMDNDQREQITIGSMDRIREAIMGPDGVYDDNGQRIIAGYVGDMEKFPDLWEARAEIKRSFAGSGWDDDPTNLTAGLGQGPDYIVDTDFVFLRPSGKFVNGKWQWLTPYRKLTDDTTTNADHTGGLETENEGQPRGLWTYYTEELNFNLSVDHTAPGATEGDNWEGPYLLTPSESKSDPGAHYAENMSDYKNLAPAWIDASGWETWEDGDYDASLGELFDEKEKFRLLNNNGRLCDGWGRSLRFFITQDPDRAGSTIFWIVSEGPDFDAKYPSKGTCSGHTWAVDANDTMSQAYDKDLDENQDNIITKIYSYEYETVFENQEQENQDATAETLAEISQALIGQCPNELNSGYTGDLLGFPDLFQWEATTVPSQWDNQDTTPTAYTKGQPRGLWTQTPNKEDVTDDLDEKTWGIGWGRFYLPEPDGQDDAQVLLDAWDRELLFFSDTANNALLVLSRGKDGLFDFGTTVDGEYAEPDNFIETLAVDAYVPTASQNQDNQVLIIRNYQFSPGYLTLGNLTVLNVLDPADAPPACTKARLFMDGTLINDKILTCATLTDEDSDGTADDWSIGTGSGSPCLDYSDTSTDTLATGARYLVVWNDIDGDDKINAGEYFKQVIFNILPIAGSGDKDDIEMDTADFQEY